jgi:hypothetical protein
MTLKWQLLENQEHPTLEAIIQVIRAFDQLGFFKPESQTEANKRLEYAAKQAAALASREIRDFKLDSFIKKVERLDKCLGTSFSEVLRDWQDPEVKADKWPRTDASRIRFLHERQALFNIAVAYQRAISSPNLVPPSIEIDVLTTRLLEERFWPTVIQEFYEKTANSKYSKAHVNLSTIEPYAILDLAKDDETHDFLVTYSKFSKISEFSKDSQFRSKFTVLHRCLLGPEDKFENADSPDEVFNSERLAVHPGCERIMEDFPWLSVFEKAKKKEYRSTTLAIHAYCRSGSGVGISHVEFLNELEQKELDVLELKPKVYGRSALICLRRTPNPEFPPVGEAESDKADCVAILEEIIFKNFDEMESNYKRSVDLNRQLSELLHSYTTVMTYVKLGEKSKYTVDAWRGTIKLRVTPSLFVNGTLEVYGDVESENEMRRSSRRFRLFGRIEFAKFGSHGQLVLRAMDIEGREIPMASFLVEYSKEGGLHCPGIDKPCLIGHWIGKEWDDSVVAPNAGVWIWHRESNLELPDIIKLIDDYRDRYPVSILPPLIQELFGKPEPTEKNGQP